MIDPGSCDRVPYHDDDGAVLVEERLVAGQRGDDGEPLLGEEVALVLVHPRPVGSPVPQPAHATWITSSGSELFQHNHAVLVTYNNTRGEMNNEDSPFPCCFPDRPFLVLLSP